MKKQKTDKKRDWWMKLSIILDGKVNLVGAIKMRTLTLTIRKATPDEAIAKALVWVKRHIRKLKRGQDFIPHTLYPVERRGEKHAPAGLMFRLKIRYSDRAILRVKNPRACFIQGYGSAAWTQVYDD